MIGEIEAVLDALNRSQVRYLVVGGVAVVKADVVDRKSLHRWLAKPWNRDQPWSLVIRVAMEKGGHVPASVIG